MPYRALHLEPEENVILEIRKHWIVFVGYVLILFFSIVSPIILFFLTKIFFPDVSYLLNNTAVFIFFYTLWLLFVWISFFIEWTKYYLDVWFVTEKRIIIVDQKDIFHREVSNIRFEKVQDVTLEVNGLIPTFFKFGNIRVQTASENSQEFYMNSVRHPELARKVIFNLQNKIYTPNR